MQTRSSASWRPSGAGSPPWEGPQAVSSFRSGIWGQGLSSSQELPQGPWNLVLEQEGGEDGGQASGALFGWAGWNKEPGLLLPTGFLTGDVSPGQRPRGVIKGTSRFTCSACSPAQVGSYISRCLNWASFIPLGPQTPRHLPGGLFLFQPVLSALRRGPPHLSPPRVSPRLPRAHSGSRSSWGLRKELQASLKGVMSPPPEPLRATGPDPVPREVVLDAEVAARFGWALTVPSDGSFRKVCRRRRLFQMSTSVFHCSFWEASPHAPGGSVSFLFLVGWFSSFRSWALQAGYLGRALALRLVAVLLKLCSSLPRLCLCLNQVVSQQ